MLEKAKPPPLFIGEGIGFEHWLLVNGMRDQMVVPFR